MTGELYQQAMELQVSDPQLLGIVHHLQDRLVRFFELSLRVARHVLHNPPSCYTL